MTWNGIYYGKSEKLTVWLTKRYGLYIIKYNQLLYTKCNFTVFDEVQE